MGPEYSVCEKLPRNRAVGLREREESVSPRDRRRCGESFKICFHSSFGESDMKTFWQFFLVLVLRHLSHLLLVLAPPRPPLTFEIKRMHAGARYREKERLTLLRKVKLLVVLVIVIAVRLL